MRRKIFICLFIIFALFALFIVKKLHLQNFWKGEKEFKELTKKTSLLKSSSGKSSNFIYIAHAGGGYNGKSYLNNLEAINNSFALGVNFVEIDFHYTLDSVVVLSHDFVKLKAREFLLDKTEGTHLTLQNLMMWMKDKEICFHLVTDIKTDNIKILQSILNRYPGII